MISLNQSVMKGYGIKPNLPVAETGGTATLELIKAIGLGYVKKKLSEHTGIEL